MVLGRKVYHILRFILEPGRWGWGQPASTDNMVAPRGLGQSPPVVCRGSSLGPPGSRRTVGGSVPFRVFEKPPARCQERFHRWRGGPHGVHYLPLLAQGCATATPPHLPLHREGGATATPPFPLRRKGAPRPPFRCAERGRSDPPSTPSFRFDPSILLYLRFPETPNLHGSQGDQRPSVPFYVSGSLPDLPRRYGGRTG